MGVADLYNACSDWSTVKKVGLHFGNMSGTFVDIILSATFLGSVTFVGK